MQSTVVAWNSIAERGTASTAAGGVTEFEHKFAAFKLEDAGQVQVEATLESDAEYGATPQSGTLIFYDGVSRYPGTLLSLLSMICVAPPLILLGVILALVGRPIARPTSQPSPRPYDAPAAPTDTGKAALGTAAVEAAIAVKYASEERVGSVTKFLSFDDRGTLRATDVGLCFAGRKHQFQLSKIERVSLARQRTAWKTLLLVNATCLGVMVLCAAIVALPAAWRAGEMGWKGGVGQAYLLAFAAYLGLFVVLQTLASVWGLFIGSQAKWVRIDHRDPNGQPCASFFAVSSALGWGGIFGGTQQLYNRLAAACGADMTRPSLPSVDTGDLRQTIHPNLLSLADVTTTSVWAIFSLIAGILSALSLCCFFPSFVLAPAAIVAGHMARHTIHQAHGLKTGGGPALTGLILGYATLLVLVVILSLLAIGRIEFDIPAVSAPTASS